jgi:hypothetical protein
MSEAGSSAKVWLVWAVLGSDRSLLGTFSSEEKARDFAAKEGEPMPYSTRVEERDVR